jgi:hypothetical protein
VLGYPLLLSDELTQIVFLIHPSQLLNIHVSLIPLVVSLLFNLQSIAVRDYYYVIGVHLLVLASGALLHSLAAPLDYKSLGSLLLIIIVAGVPQTLLHSGAQRLLAKSIPDLSQQCCFAHSLRESAYLV